MAGTVNVDGTLMVQAKACGADTAIADVVSPSSNFTIFGAVKSVSPYSLAISLIREVTNARPNLRR
jgi:hypothetical protein